MMELGQQAYSQNPDASGNPTNSNVDDAIETDFSTEK